MPLLDHFHAPLHPQRRWEAFHSRWASAIADALNADLLPPDYFAEPETHAAGRVKIDVAAFEPACARASYAVLASCRHAVAIRFSGAIHLASAACA